MANKTIELRKDIQHLLKSVFEKTFYRRADSGIEYPYLVYTIRDVDDYKILEVDFWDEGSNTENIENIADNVEEALDEFINTNENHSISIFKNDDRKWIDDENKNILRINESFQILYYGRNSK